MLVELPKIPSVVGLQEPSRRRKTFRWLKGLGCKLVELLGGNKGKSSMVVDGLTSSLIWSQGGDCCESDSKLEKLKFAEAVKIGARFGEIRARFSGSELALSFVKNRSTILRRFRKIKRIFGLDLLQFYEGYFYYNYRHCLNVNLEIEGAETRV